MGKEVKTKLKVEDYVFEIDGEDIFNTELIYSFKELEVFYYKKGEKNTEIVPLIEIELNGLDRDNKEGWISFCLKTDLDYLNSLPKDTIVNINDLLWQTDAYVKRPKKDYSDFLTFRFPENNEKDMYKMLTSLLVYKKKNNEFIFKLHLPNEVFTYFKISFKK